MHARAQVLTWRILRPHTASARCVPAPHPPPQLLLAPCYQAAPNTTIDMTVDKTIAIVGLHLMNEWDGVDVAAFR